MCQILEIPVEKKGWVVGFPILTLVCGFEKGPFRVPALISEMWSSKYSERL